MEDAMSSRPDSMEALKIMSDYLRSIEKHEDQSVYFRCAAMCAGLSAVVYELKALREAVTAKAQ
jgi:hypothetical protein